MSPLDSELPILRFIFVHHVREFPFLDKAKEKEFWQDKLQTVRMVRGTMSEFWANKWVLVSRIVCYEADFVIGRQARGDKAEEIVYKMSEIG